MTSRHVSTRVSSGVVFEQVESRLLFAVTASPTVLADQQTVQADLQQINVDRAASRAALISNRQAFVAAVGARAHGDPALLQKLRDDRTAFRTKFQQSVNARLTAVQANRAQIQADLLQILADRGNFNLVAADRLKLASDRLQLRSDLDDINATIFRDRSDMNTTLRQDQAAIVLSRGTGAINVQAARTKLFSDQATSNAAIRADMSKLFADRQKLVADVRAGV